MRSLLQLAATLAAAVVVGVAVPLGWLLIGATIQGSTGARPLVFLALVVTIVGIAVTYGLIMLAAGGLLARRLPPDGHPRRYNWTRSMRGERHEAPELNSLERTFVTAAVLVTAVYLVWVFLFAGSPLPAPGGP